MSDGDRGDGSQPDTPSPPSTSSDSSPPGPRQILRRVVLGRRPEHDDHVVPGSSSQQVPNGIDQADGAQGTDVSTTPDIPAQVQDDDHERGPDPGARRPQLPGQGQDTETMTRTWIRVRARIEDSPANMCTPIRPCNRPFCRKRT